MKAIKLSLSLEVALFQNPSNMEAEITKTWRYKTRNIITLNILGIFCFYFGNSLSAGICYFRFLGYGLHLTNSELMFSERQGFTKYLAIPKTSYRLKMLYNEDIARWIGTIPRWMAPIHLGISKTSYRLKMLYNENIARWIETILRWIKKNDNI